MKATLACLALIALLAAGCGGAKHSTSHKRLDLRAVLTELRAQIPTIQQTYIFTEQRDPNNNLGKPGYYIAGVAFHDTRLDPDADVSDPSFGADAGGEIEVYANDSDAAKRVESLKAFQGSILDPGAVARVSNVVVRASNYYTKSQQDEIVRLLSDDVRCRINVCE